MKIAIPWKKSATLKELRQFALVMTGGLGLIGTAALLKGRPAGPYLLAIAGLFLLLGILSPKSLRWPYALWMAFAFVLGQIVTTIILTLLFFVVITPMGLLMRLLGKDLLQKRWKQAEASSYWMHRKDYNVEKDRLSRPY
jgi:hypothetical protein